MDEIENDLRLEAEEKIYTLCMTLERYLQQNKGSKLRGNHMVVTAIVRAMLEQAYSIGRSHGKPNLNV